MSTLRPHRPHRPDPAQPSVPATRHQTARSHGNRRSTRRPNRAPAVEAPASSGRARTSVRSVGPPVDTVRHDLRNDRFGGAVTTDAQVPVVPAWRVGRVLKGIALGLIAHAVGMGVAYYYVRTAKG